MHIRLCGFSKNYGNPAQVNAKGVHLSFTFLFSYIYYCTTLKLDYPDAHLDIHLIHIHAENTKSYRLTLQKSSKKYLFYFSVFLFPKFCFLMCLSFASQQILRLHFLLFKVFLRRITAQKKVFFLDTSHYKSLP